MAKRIAGIQKTLGGLSYDVFAGRLQARLEFLHWSHPHQVCGDGVWDWAWAWVGVGGCGRGCGRGWAWVGVGVGV